MGKYTQLSNQLIVGAVVGVIIFGDERRQHVEVHDPYFPGVPYGMQAQVTSTSTAVSTGFPMVSR